MRFQDKEAELLSYYGDTEAEVEKRFRDGCKDRNVLTMNRSSPRSDAVSPERSKFIIDAIVEAEPKRKLLVEG